MRPPNGVANKLEKQAPVSRAKPSNRPSSPLEGRCDRSLVATILTNATPTRRAASDFYFGRPNLVAFPTEIASMPTCDTLRPPNVMARQRSRLARSLLSFDKASPAIEGARRPYEF
jgi:hypothetical protein